MKLYFNFHIDVYQYWYLISSIAYHDNKLQVPLELISPYTLYSYDSVGPTDGLTKPLTRRCVETTRPLYDLISWILFLLVSSILSILVYWNDLVARSDETTTSDMTQQDFSHLIHLHTVRYYIWPDQTILSARPNHILCIGPSCSSHIMVNIKYFNKQCISSR